MRKSSRHFRRILRLRRQRSRQATRQHQVTDAMARLEMKEEDPPRLLLLHLGRSHRRRQRDHKLVRRGPPVRRLFVPIQMAIPTLLNWLPKPSMRWQLILSSVTTSDSFHRITLKLSFTQLLMLLSRKRRIQTAL